MKRYYSFIAVLALSLSMVCSCSDYADQLELIGKRLDALEDSITALEDTVIKIEHNVNYLETLVELLETNASITDVTEEDGLLLLHLFGSFGGDEERDSVLTIPLAGTDGTDGTGLKDLLSVRKGDDGRYYWTFNGDWMLDDNGNKIPASGTDGADGEDAPPYTDTLVLPEIRLNSDGIYTWWVSYDQGKTWHDTHVPADGTNGKNGKNGQDGDPDSVILDVIVSDGEVTFIVVLESGTVTAITIPLLSA